MAVETGESSETIIHEELNDVEKKTTASIPGLTGMSGRAGTFGVSCGPRDLNNEIRGVSLRLMNRKGYAQVESLPFGSTAMDNKTSMYGRWGGNAWTSALCTHA